MLTVKRKYSYKAFGLHFLSDISISELPKVILNHEASDSLVEVKIGDLSRYIEELLQNNNIIVKENFVLFLVQNVAIYMIQDGNKVTIFPLGKDIKNINIYLISTCMAALLLQRRILPLHASTINIKGKAYSFVGVSGIGKSTLAKAFIDLGYSFLSDDIIGVTISKEGRAIAIPAFPEQKLWIETINEFGMSQEKYERIAENISKYSIPIPNFEDSPLELAGVFELEKTISNEAHVSKILNLERIRTFYNHTFRRAYIPALGLMNWHFDLISRIVNYVDFYRIKRPDSGFSVDKLQNIIFSLLNDQIERPYQKN
ncbi:aldolase [Fredinandcohnia humi]